MLGKPAGMVERDRVCIASLRPISSTNLADPTAEVVKDGAPRWQRLSGLEDRTDAG